MDAISPRDVARLRLHMLGLRGNGANDTGDGDDHSPGSRDVVAHHLAMQAQDWGASQWAIGSRMARGTTASDVRAAYDAGQIVRSWPMRGTVHAVCAEDIGWLLDLTGVKALAGAPRRRAALGIDVAFLARCERVARTLLGGGGRATRAELREALMLDGIDVSSGLLYHVVWFLAQTGVLVLGPTNDRGEPQLVLLDEWVRSARRFDDRDAALCELARGYVRARGPVSVDDFAHWSKLSKTDCRTGIDACGDELTQVTCDGTPLWLDRAALDRVEAEADASSRTPRSLEHDAFALAAFDEHLLGYRTRDHVLDPDHATLVDPARNGVFRWTIVDRGRVVATWRRTRRARAMRVDVDPFAAPLSHAAQRRITRALARYGTFIEQPLDVHFTTPEAA